MANSILWGLVLVVGFFIGLTTLVPDWYVAEGPTIPEGFTLPVEDRDRVFLKPSGEPPNDPNTSGISPAIREVRDFYRGSRVEDFIEIYNGEDVETTFILRYIDIPRSTREGHKVLPSTWIWLESLEVSVPSKTIKRVPLVVFAPNKFRNIPGEMLEGRIGMSKKSGGFVTVQNVSTWLVYFKPLPWWLIRF